MVKINTDLLKLKSYTQGLMNHVHYIEHEFPVKPKKKHHLTAINFNDIKERREDFLNALVNTVSSWVYSKATREKILFEQEEKSGDKAHAGSFLTNMANRKFRPGHPQGQFGELLLFNFLQHFFHAVPLVRKQRITTNIELERNGADAIHYAHEKEEHVFYLGESKCYESKYNFKTAFTTSLSSIKNTFDKFDEELDLYTYEEFIEKELLEIAKQYKEGTLENVRFELVCIVIYNEHKNLDKNNEAQIKEDILKIVNEKCAGIEDEHFTSIHPIIHRLHYILFPVWALDELLDAFQKKVGSEKVKDAK